MIVISKSVQPGLFGKKSSSGVSDTFNEKWRGDGFFGDLKPVISWETNFLAFDYNFKKRPTSVVRQKLSNQISDKANEKSKCVFFNKLKTCNFLENTLRRIYMSFQKAPNQCCLANVVFPSVMGNQITYNSFKD